MRRICINYFILLMMLFIHTPILAKVQTPDQLIYEGKTYCLRVFHPSYIEQYCERKNVKNPFNSSGMIMQFNSGLERGYIATWKIENEKLFLLKIETEELSDSLESTYKEYDLKKLFIVDGKSEIFAYWITGWLFCDLPDKIPAYTFYIKDGILVSKKQIIIPKLLGEK